jgi:protein-disulfide isomerase
MKRLIHIAAALSALALGACGANDAADNAGISAAEVAAVAPPAGQKWTEVASATPEGGFIMGNPNAAVKLLEFGSFTCPHCREFGEKSGPERNAMVETGKMSFEYRTFVRDPLDLTLALTAHCGGPAPFFALSEQIFAQQSDIITKMQALGEPALNAITAKPMNARFTAIAEAVGLIDFAKKRGIPEAKLRACLSDTAMIDKMVKQVQADTAKYNIQGTPTLVMNGTVVENVAGWEDMRAKLKAVGL